MRYLLSLVFIVLGVVCAQALIKVACVGNSISFDKELAATEQGTSPALLQQMLGSDYVVAKFVKPETTLLLRFRRQRNWGQMEWDSPVSWIIFIAVGSFFGLIAYLLLRGRKAAKKALSMPPHPLARQLADLLAKKEDKAAISALVKQIKEAGGHKIFNVEDNVTLAVAIEYLYEEDMEANSFLQEASKCLRIAENADPINGEQYYLQWYNLTKEMVDVSFENNLIFKFCDGNYLKYKRNDMKKYISSKSNTSRYLPPQNGVVR